MSLEIRNDNESNILHWHTERNSPMNKDQKKSSTKQILRFKLPKSTLREAEKSSKTEHLYS